MNGALYRLARVLLRACAEFPNDNPALHAGRVSLCEDPWSPAPPQSPRDTPLAPALAPAPAPALAPAPAPTPADPFRVLVHLIEDVARERGASRDLLAAVGPVFNGARLERGTPGGTVEALLAGSHVLQATGELEPTDAFAATVRAWQGILRGESDDLSACGGALLDEWAADVLSRILGFPAQAAGLRRDLRGHGVAAFGLVTSV